MYDNFSTDFCCRVTSEMEYLQVVWYNSLNNRLRYLVYVSSNHTAVDVMHFTYILAWRNSGTNVILDDAILYDIS